MKAVGYEHCCEAHVPVHRDRVGWCLNAPFSGVESCCELCPDYDWDYMEGRYATIEDDDDEA